jgi:glycine/D-amino acid oxidase-like deaminating enzyme
MVAAPHDVVVVGAGGFGAAVAYHASARGLRTLVVERGAPAAGTSAQAAGIAMHVHPTAAGSRLAIRSAELVARLRAETGRALDLHRAGSLKVARTAAHARIVAEEIAFGRSLGVAIEPLGRAEATALAPWLDLRSATAISIVRPDAHFEPADLPRLYLDAAAARGATIASGTHATGLVVRDGAVAGVETPGGPIAARAVVVAAGAFTAALAATAGVEIPVVAVRHELFVTGPPPATELTQPHVRVMDANAYARPYRGGLMFGAYEAAPTLVDVAAAAADATALASPRAALAARAAPVLDVIPALRGARALEVRAGVVAMSPDGLYVVDELPGARGTIAITGDNVMGLHVTPAVGEAVATWLAEGERPAVLAPFALARFAGRAAGVLRAAALAQYATKYQHLDDHVAR